MNLLSLIGAVGLSAVCGLQPRAAINSNIESEYSYNGHYGSFSFDSNYSFESLYLYIEDYLSGGDECYFATVHCAVMPTNNTFGSLRNLGIDTRTFTSTTDLTRYFTLARSDLNGWRALFGYIDLFSGYVNDTPTYNYSGSLTRYYFSNMYDYSLKVCDYFIEDYSCRFAYASNYDATHLLENYDSDFDFISTGFTNTNNAVYNRMDSYNERFYGLNADGLKDNVSHGSWCEYFNCYSYCVRTHFTTLVGELDSISTRTIFTFDTLSDLSVTNAYDNGYASGYAEGTNDGYNQGYATGKTDGIAESNDYTFMGLFGAIADTPVLMIRNLFNFDLFGVNVLTVILSLFTALILFFIFRKIV